MSIEVKVPVLPESVADALVLPWAKRVGEQVNRDEIVVEVETDKVVLEVPAPADGILTEILVAEGDTVVAEQVLARLEPAATASGSAAVAESEPAADSTAVDVAGLSPAVRRLVAETGIDPATIKGTGRGGRITKADVLQKIAQTAPADDAAPPSQLSPATDAAPLSPPSPVTDAAPPPSQPSPATDAAPPPSPPVTGVREQVREPMTRLRQTIAARLVQAQQTAAMLTTFNEVNMQPVMTLRARHQEAFEKRHGVRLGFTSFFVKASVAALEQFPLVNAYIDGNDIVRPNYHDIGIAVSSPRGLVVPVLRDCARLDFAAIESCVRDFAARARDAKITLDELTGGTFTITNGGVFGSLLSTPILNPPQSAILGMHKIQERPVVENGTIVARPMMYLALSYDHRIIDGREAVQFLVTIKDMLEDPARLLLAC